MPVGGVPMLRRMITNLMRGGFDQFVIGTGHLEHMIRDAVESWFPDLDVTYVLNPDYRTTNNALSLSLTRPHVDGDGFILLDGDVVFDLEVIEELVARGPDCIAVRSVGDIGLEDVKVTADVHDRVLAIGKHVPVRTAMGESIGIELFSKATTRRLFEVLDLRVRRYGLVHEYYEAAFQQMINEGTTLYGIDIGSRYATEIDTPDDLVLANRSLACQPAFDTRMHGIRIAV